MTDQQEAVTPGSQVVERTTFGSLDIGFDSRVLRPRQWTTAQSRWAAELLPGLPDGPVLELCAGAGQIGLLALVDSTRRLMCVDASERACAYTRENALEAGMIERVEVRHAHLERALRPTETFALIIADPPWVRRLDTSRFPDDPPRAIDGGEDGLDVARACLRVIRHHLTPGGSAILQLGTTAQADILRREESLLPGLTLGEVRQHSGGVLVKIDRAPDTGV